MYQNGELEPMVKAAAAKSAEASPSDS